jgi:hypothetical protein
VQAKKWCSVEIKIIATHRLGDGVSLIVKWEDLLMGPYETAPSANVSIICLQPEISVVPCVDHGASCT